MKKFGEWVEELKKDMLNTFVDKDLRLDQRQKDALPLLAVYQQEKLLEKNRNLVLATWALAGVTIILAIITWLK